MYKLVVVQNGRIQKNIPLRHSHALIGRKPDSDIRLEEKQVSGHHAKLTINNNEVFIEDLDSTNGTSVNGQPLEKSLLLQTGDQISIGNYKLIFVTEHGDSEDPDATVMVSSKSRPRPASTDFTGETNSGFTRYLIWILIISLLAGLAIMLLK